MKENSSNINLNKIGVYISITIYIISLTQQCYCTNNGCLESVDVVTTGIIGFFVCPAGFSWLANPFLIASWILSSRKHRLLSLVLSVISVLLSLFFLFFHAVVTDESGQYRTIIGYRLGYWLWLTSCLVMLIGNLHSYYSSRTNDTV